MYKICKTERSTERQKLFQSTLLSMMHRQKYQEISVTSLCQQMQVPRKNFYRYFEGLEDVLYSLMDEALAQSFLCLEVEIDLIGFFTQWKNQKYLLDALEKNGMSHVMVNRLYEHLGKSIQQEPFSVHHMRHSASISAIMTMVFSWHHSGMQQSEEEMCVLAKSILKFREE